MPRNRVVGSRARIPRSPGAKSGWSSRSAAAPPDPPTASTAPRRPVQVVLASQVADLLRGPRVHPEQGVDDAAGRDVQQREHRERDHHEQQGQDDEPPQDEEEQCIVAQALAISFSSTLCSLTQRGRTCGPSGCACRAGCRSALLADPQQPGAEVVVVAVEVGPAYPLARATVASSLKSGMNGAACA